MRDGTAKFLSTLHSTAFRLTGGRMGRRLVNNDMVLLTTTGRTSGNAHTVPLLYLRDGDRLVVFASWGGRDYHPEWYLNLLADSRAEVSIRGEHQAVQATTATDEERTMWWGRATEAYSGYAEYQARTDRLIPVVLLDPV
jgi:deazaflavin-dependent oxidoreductase (nitroreductase family)